MPARPKTPEEREQERSYIIQAALKMFAKTGYDGLTMRNIALECGISATKIYYYFSSKEELYFCLMKQGFSTALQQLQDAFCKGQDARSRMILVNNAMFDFGYHNPHYYQIMLTYDVPRKADYIGTPLQEISEEATAVALDYYQFWCKCLREMGTLNGFEISKYELSALFSMIHGTINLANSRVLHEVEIDYPKLCDVINQEFVRWFTLHER